jgi:hypothetical protein
MGINREINAEETSIVERWIALIIFGGGGLVLVYVGVTQYFLQRRLLANAVTIEAQIIKSEIHKSVSSDTDTRLLRDNSTISYRPDVRFRYTFRGTEYESDLLRPTIIVHDYASADSVSQELAPFPVGAEVRAYLDAENPDKAYLLRESGAGPVVFIIVGLILPPLAWFVGKYI